MPHKVMMLDYDLSYTHDMLMRLADVGVKNVLVFNYWHWHEPQRSHYNFDNLLSYARTCTKAGMRMLLQTPVGAPEWAPESWFLRNSIGQSNAFLEWRNDWYWPSTTKVRSTTSSVITAYRFLSYWHHEAEEHTKLYVRTLREAVEPEGAICIPNVGSMGSEVLFPGIHETLQNYAVGPWWFDDYATKLRGEQNPIDWFRQERYRIVAERLSWYKEKWLGFTTIEQDYDWRLGMTDIDEVLEANSDGLNILVFMFFVATFLFVDNDHYVARRRAKKYSMWVGAEGCRNVVTNTSKAIDLGMRGTICGPLFTGFGTPRFEDWMYHEIAKANSL